MASKTHTPPKIVLGCMTFGEEGKEQSRVHDLPTCQAIIDVYGKYGNELDSARMYGNGTSEEFLAKLKASQKYKIATKNFPSKRVGGPLDFAGYTHEKADVHRSMKDSLTALGVDKVDLYYLHAPDRQVPFEETLGALNEEYNAGHFERLGLSNYKASEVEEMYNICEKNGWVKPSVYQGLYNAITRSAEPELFPVLRKLGISYYAYNPLGGGFFTGAYKPEKHDADTQQEGIQEGSRFDKNRWQGKMYRKRYFQDNYFNALEVLRPVAEKHNLRLAEVALRWMMNHSILSGEHGDAVIIGASSTNHISQNVADLAEGGPLPDEVLKAVDEAWEVVKPTAPAYHH